MIQDKIILFCMTSDIAFDQRMQRITSTLSKGNIGIIVHQSKSNNIPQSDVKLIDNKCIFRKGIIFYLEYNLRLYIKLLKINPDIIYCVDTDTLLGGGFYRLNNKKIFIYDSHEYFIEVPELEGKYFKKKVWSKIEKWFIPKMDLCITVGDKLAEILSHRFNKSFYTIRNVPFTSNNLNKALAENLIIYQGAINKGRGLHCAIDAMEYLTDYTLMIIGDGDIKEDLMKYAHSKPFTARIIFKNAVLPCELKSITSRAKFGLNLIENTSLSYYYSLANKFFDYLQAEVPSVNMKYPEYERILDNKRFGLMLENMEAKALADVVRKNSIDINYKTLKENCRKYKTEYTWENEEQKLLSLFHSLK